MTAPLEAVAYVHEAHEGLARFREPLERAGFRPVERFRAPDPEADAGRRCWSSSGGRWGSTTPTGFPSWRRRRRCSGPGSPRTGPRIGLCLGAQLLAAAAGSTGPGAAGGRSSASGRSIACPAEDPLLAQLPETFDVVHWHGDTFDPVPGRGALPGGHLPRPGLPRRAFGGAPVPRRARPGGVPGVGGGVGRRAPAERAGPGCPAGLRAPPARGRAPRAGPAAGRARPGPGGGAGAGPVGAALKWGAPGPYGGHAPHPARPRGLHGRPPRPRRSETRSVSGFTRIDLAAPVDLEVRPGSFGATLEMDSEVARQARRPRSRATRCTSRSTAGTCDFHGKQRIKVTMPELRGLPHPGQRGRGHRGLQGPGEGRAPDLRLRGREVRRELRRGWR